MLFSLIFVKDRMVLAGGMYRLFIIVFQLIKLGVVFVTRLFCSCSFGDHYKNRF